MILKQCLRAALIGLAASACGRPAAPGPEKDRQAMVQADIEFSRLSKEKGMRHAFLAYMDTGAVLLRPGRRPITGAPAVHFLRMLPDTGVTLTWAPSRGEIAASGELGYTYGVYTFAGRDTTMQGTYVTIWKKDAAGNWKFVLDSGNEGL